MFDTQYAIPVLIFGVAAGLLLGRMSREHSAATRGKKNPHAGDCMMEGISTGLLVGAVLGMTGVMNIVPATLISALGGMVVGMNIKKKK